MTRYQVDESIQRVETEGFQFPLGVYPAQGEDLVPQQGYTLSFEQADGENIEGDWEEWPDRYVFDVLVSANRIEALCRSLFAMMPGRVYPILDILGNDAYREIDPYVAYELVGQERFIDGIRRYRDFLLEDGMVGFGAMSEEPFMYVFVDEHKVITIRVETEQREHVEKLMEAFDLQEVAELNGADSVTHEHRGVLAVDESDPECVGAEEIVEHLRDEWGLTLNVDPEGNIDDEGKELGVVPWRVLVRCAPTQAECEQAAKNGENHQPSYKYAEMLLCAASLGEAEELAWSALYEQLGMALEPANGGEDNGAGAVDGRGLMIVAADRLGSETCKELAAKVGVALKEEEKGVWFARWA